MSNHANKNNERMIMKSLRNDVARSAFLILWVVICNVKGSHFLCAWV